MKHCGPTVTLTLVITLTAMAGNADDTDIVINELSCLGSSGNEWVELLNTGAETIPVGDDLVLGPSEILVVAAGMDFNDTVSDLGLYMTSSSASAAAMVDFV